ncbi:MAG TPA: LuxR C-terminal-related transcriptional regulator [Propionicimonas sp.]|uniref:LuxR C-terminal-related transcriptional regulator n=1 Tax=Propionicimonas sp. TaxID=1955623 RepID=UPI002F422D4D
MTGEVPPTLARQRKHTDGPAPESRQLPASLGPWVAALTLWPTVQEHGYRLVSRAFGDGRVPGWTFFTSLVVHAGLVEPDAVADTYAFREAWRPELERELEVLGGADATRATLVDAWTSELDPEVVSEIAQWARRLERWDVLERIWLLLGERTGDLSEDALAVLRDLPVEARRARPILTWASGAADSVLADTPRKEAEGVLQRLLLDSALLHADWSVREDTDEAVSAGTFRMIGERRLPSTRVGQSLDAAWRTKQEIDAFIDVRSRAGDGPGRTPQAIFRAFSARLALFRMDAPSAINEARWATILADWEPVAVIAAGVEALATSISTEEGPAHYSEPPISRIDDDLGVRGLRGQGQVFEILADANEAVRRLDRQELDRCLALVSPETAALAGAWAVRTSLVGWRAALWGDPTTGANELSAEIARLSLIGKEQDEPLGRVVLGRIRVILLTKVGAFAAALQAAESLPEGLKLLSQARVHLWSGQYRQSSRLADAGPFQPGLEMSERYRLTTVRAAAALLDGSSEESIRVDAVREVRRLLGVGSFVHLALLPKAARDALLELCRPEVDGEPNLELLLARLGQLNDAGDGGVRPLHLTEREAVLLPLLATDDSVPEIARKLMVSVNTVRKQVVTLREKFQADTRAELVRRARTYGALG